MSARMLQLTMWYAGHGHFDAWWAAAQRVRGLEYLATFDLLEAHRAAELRALNPS